MKHLLLLKDKKFAQDISLIFHAFNVLQKRDVSLHTSILIRQPGFNSTARHIDSLTNESLEQALLAIENNTGIVGITKYASEQLGDIVFVELPEKGSQAEKGKDIAVVESVKAASEIYSPVSGIIVDTNENLNDAPCF